jgi:hypothetical protein
MKSNRINAGWLMLLALSTLSLQPATALAQGTAFTYQGKLTVGTNAANGLYDLQFVLNDALSGGNQIAGPLTNSATGVTNGLFTVTLDFGSGVFTGPARWLEVDVRTNGNGAFTTLLPRQAVTPSPYAVYSATATTAGSVPASGVGPGTANISITGNAGTATSAAVAGAAVAANTSLTATMATNAITAINFSGSLAGDVTGWQNATTVATVGGQTAASVASGVVLANAATSANTPSTIVKRTSGGNLTSTSITLAGNLNLPATTATSAGIIYSGPSPLIHAYGNQNFFAGSQAGNFSLTGYQNTGIGYQALTNVSSGIDNTAVGYQALQNNWSAQQNTALGAGALANNDNDMSGLASENTAIGYQALYSNVDGIANVANGFQALRYNTNGNYNTANGKFALEYNTTGSENVADGHDALRYNTTGSYNTANGSSALYTNTSGNNNVADGALALYSNTSGSNNIALGYQAGYNLTTGSSNIDIGNMGVAGDNSIIRIGTTQPATFLAGNVYGTSFNPTSDRNVKENFQPVDYQAVLAKVASLPVTQWNFKTESKDVQHIGPMAQDFQAAFQLSADDKHISLVDEGGVALAAIQGLNQKLNEKDAEIQGLKQSVAELKAMVEKLAGK